MVAAIVGTMALLGYLSIRYLPSDGTASYSNPPEGSPMATSANAQPSEDWADDTGAIVHKPLKTKYILHKDIQKRIGRSLVTYRGKSDGSSIILDVVVLDLDPNTTYTNTIDISRAAPNFQVGEERFELISAGSLRLRVWHRP